MSRRSRRYRRLVSGVSHARKASANGGPQCHEDSRQDPARSSEGSLRLGLGDLKRAVVAQPLDVTHWGSRLKREKPPQGNVARDNGQLDLASFWHFVRGPHIPVKKPEVLVCHGFAMSLSSTWNRTGTALEADLPARSQDVQAYHAQWQHSLNPSPLGPSSSVSSHVP